MPCVGCNKSVSPFKSIKCCVCLLSYYSLCTSFGNISSYNKLGSQINQWKCGTCGNTQNITMRKNNLNTIQDKQTSVKPETVDVNNIQASINSILNKLKKLDLLVISFSEIQDLLSFCKNKIDEFSIKLDNAMSKVNDNSKQILIIDRKIFKKQEEIDSLKVSHNINEKIKLNNNLDISGIPVTTNESLIDILLKLASLVKMDFVKEDISNIYRIKRTNNLNSNSNIIVIFNNMNKKAELI